MTRHEENLTRFFKVKNGKGPLRSRNIGLVILIAALDCILKESENCSLKSAAISADEKTKNELDFIHRSKSSNRRFKSNNKQQSTKFNGLRRKIAAIDDRLIWWNISPQNL